MSFFDNGLHFTCTQCSHCCRIEPGFVFLSRDDLTKLCRWFNLTEERFIEKYCCRVPYYDETDVLCLRETAAYDCILWNSGCTAYGARPVQCSTYPFWTRLLSDRAAWNDEKKSCPGIGTGRLWAKNEIMEQLASYAHNEPLHFPKNDSRGERN
ncbi:MAG TPA: zinc/iron-chelating domain-containing protein [Treponema sp.]|nr:zinc/iron-chelating domain-containing protein [Treponema sp.]